MIQSIEERPGNLNTGLITLVNNAPKNSNKPKLSSNGKNNPANKNIENNTVKRSCNTKAPVSLLIIISGPTLRVTSNPNIPPSTLEVNQIEVVLNSEFKSLLFIINFGLKTVAIKLNIAEIISVMVIMYTKYSPRKFTSFPEKIAIGIVTSPSCFIGIIYNKTPIREGIMNFNLSFKETLVLSLSNGFKFETSIFSPFITKKF